MARRYWLGLWFVAIMGLAAFVAADAIDSAAAPATQPVNATTSSSIDFHALLGDPPAVDSPVQQVELAQILELQAGRTPADEKRCKDEVSVTVFGFSAQMGSWFTEKNLPITARLMNEAYAHSKVLSEAAKRIWDRKRPPFDDPRIKPCVAADTDGSYPSGHATRSMLWAHLLIAILPQQTEGLLARANQIGDDRVLAGVHFPSDVAAGKILGAEIAKELLADEEFQTKLAAARAECLAASASAAAAAKSSQFFDNSVIDIHALLGEPPSPGSAIQQVELAQILEFQAARTPAEERRCQDEGPMLAFGFTPQIGPWFTEKNLPLTAKALNDAYLQCKDITKTAKAVWNRQAPPNVDSRIHPCMPRDEEGCYPSGHSSRSMLFAHLLGAIFPARMDVLITRADQLGDDRVLAGVHYPSDVAAGKILGAKVAELLLASDKFKSEFEAARAECLAAAAANPLVAGASHGMPPLESANPLLAAPPVSMP
jgi:acid phosphatase (class A)